MTFDVAAKLLESLGKQFSVSVVSSENILSQTVAAIRLSLQDGAENEVLRLVAELYNQLVHCSHEHILQETKADPGLLGNPKWDAMIGSTRDIDAVFEPKTKVQN